MLMHNPIAGHSAPAPLNRQAQTPAPVVQTRPVSLTTKCTLSPSALPENTYRHPNHAAPPPAIGTARPASDCAALFSRMLHHLPQRSLFPRHSCNLFEAWRLVELLCFQLFRTCRSQFPHQPRHIPPLLALRAAAESQQRLQPFAASACAPGTMIPASPSLAPSLVVAHYQFRKIPQHRGQRIASGMRIPLAHNASPPVFRPQQPLRSACVLHRPSTLNAMPPSAPAPLPAHFARTTHQAVAPTANAPTSAPTSTAESNRPAMTNRRRSPTQNHREALTSHALSAARHPLAGQRSLAARATTPLPAVPADCTVESSIPHLRRRHQLPLGIRTSIAGPVKRTLFRHQALTRLCQFEPSPTPGSRISTR